MLGLELDVEHRADDLHDLADIVIAVAVAMTVICSWLPRLTSYPWSAAAPPTISAISCVICA